MNFVMFVIGLALPLTISGYSLLQMNSSFVMDKAAENIASNGLGIISTLDDDFTIKLKLCIILLPNTNDFRQCLKDEGAKAHIVIDPPNVPNPSDPKVKCCYRVVLYECTKKFLTPMCNVSKEEVDSHDDEHFHFWNDADVKITGNCTGNREQSIAYCNGFSKITFNLILQIASILALFIIVIS